MMIGVSGTSKTGRLYYYYKCSNAMHRKSCDKKTAQKAWIERLVVMLTRNYVLCDDVIARLADAIVDLQKRENTILPFLQKQLDETNKRIDNLLNAIEEGLMNASAKQRLDGLEEKKAELEISIAREKIEKVPLSREQIIFWISKFKDGDIDDPAYCRAIVDIFVNSVLLFDDRLVIGFNWKDGTKTLSLAELETAADNAISPKTPNPSGILGSYLDADAPFK